MKLGAIVIDARDNVATALEDLSAGDRVSVQLAGEQKEIELAAPIRFGHKLAIAAIAERAPVIKYGEVIGRATRGIAVGEHVHVHNLESLRGRGDLS